MGQDAALAVEDIARVTLAALHTVMIAVTLQADGSTARLADTHTALVVAVGRAGDRWNRRDQSQGAANGFLTALFREVEGRGQGRGVRLATLPHSYPLLMKSLCPIPYLLNNSLVCRGKGLESLHRIFALSSVLAFAIFLACHCENSPVTTNPHLG